MPDTITTNDPRAVLRVAQEAASEVTARVTKVQEAERRARALLAEREERLAAVVTSAERELAKRADAIKAWATEGGDRPQPEKKSRGAEQQDAEDAVRSSRAAMEALESDRIAAEQAKADADRAIKEAAHLVIYEEAGRIGDEMAALRSRYISLAESLAMLGHVWFPLQNPSPGKPSVAPMRLPQNAIDQLELARPTIGQIVHRHGVRSTVIHQSEWRAYYDALLTNADTTLPKQV
jgi:hypothetical protein